MKRNRRREIVTLVVVFVGVLLVSALVVYLIGGRETTPQYKQVPQPAETNRESVSRPTPKSPADESFFDRMIGTRSSETDIRGESWIQTMGRIALRLLLATLLTAALAYRPRRRILTIKPNPYVSQTQILLAVVAAALMIIVGDNAARAFGIFAAVSLVRFRTNIRDPKEITVLLISLALGLAAGVGRWDLALILAIFSLIVLWILEWREPQMVFRSMEVKLTTRNVIATQQALRAILKKHDF